ncbi:hypothetical protein AGMMS49928_19660 [Spirochaetia bacterium]|nr:hypothetical protein AGMMS49928_19660 [Spirochaetia bacterium]
MGTVVTEITLTNAGDKVRVEAGVRACARQETVSARQETVSARQETVSALVDTGASMLVINEELQQRLGLEIEGRRWTTFADGGRKECGITEGVNIRWQNRDCFCSAIVIPGAKSILLGVIPLENMDLIVNPVTQILEGAHGDEVVTLAL